MQLDKTKLIKNMNKLSILGLGLSLLVAPLVQGVQANEVSVQKLEEVSTLKEHQENSKQPTNVKVFFPVGGEARDDFDDVQAVNRWTNQVGVARFAISELIEGPTASEQRQGLVDTIDTTGESVCGGRDFTIDIEQNTATLQFCRTTPLGGVGDIARADNAIRKTLKQFSTVDEVLILNKNGDCWQDLSGRNVCFED